MEDAIPPLHQQEFCACTWFKQTMYKRRKRQPDHTGYFLVGHGPIGQISSENRS